MIKKDILKILYDLNGNYKFEKTLKKKNLFIYLKDKNILIIFIYFYLFIYYYN